MPTQADFLRIRQHLIEPLCAVFGREYNAPLIEAIVEDLAGYTNEILCFAVKDLRRNSRYLPKISEIIVACQKAPGPERPRAEKLVKYSENEKLCVEVMHSSFGQIALREGWAGSLWLRVFETGKTEWSQVDAPSFRKSLWDAVEAAKGLEIVPEGQQMTPLSKALLSLWNAMMQRERDLTKTYMKVAA